MTLMKSSRTLIKDMVTQQNIIFTAMEGQRLLP